MEIQTNQNFLSVYSKTARSSYGEFFTAGEKLHTMIKVQDRNSLRIIYRRTYVID